MRHIGINVRGTSGSGKTHAMRNLIELTQAKPSRHFGKKVEVYTGKYEGFEVAVLGTYESNCGGCDTIQPYARIPDLITEFMRPGWILLYEGLLISHSIGVVGEAVKPYGDSHVMAFLDTPLDTCLTRIDERRAGQGKPPLANRTNTIKDYKAVSAAKVRAEQQGFRVESVPHLSAHSFLESLIRNHML